MNLKKTKTALCNQCLLVKNVSGFAITPLDFRCWHRFKFKQEKQNGIKSINFENIWTVFLNSRNPLGAIPFLLIRIHQNGAIIDFIQFCSSLF